MCLSYKVFYISDFHVHMYIKSSLYRMMMSHLITTLHEILFAGALLKWHNTCVFQKYNYQ